MRVECQTVRAFVENLHMGEPVEKAVWIDESRREISEHKVLCSLQASAVVQMKVGGEFLLSYGEDLGFDFSDGKSRKEGSVKMKSRRDYLEECCNDMGLMVRPGIVSE